MEEKEKEKQEMTIEQKQQKAMELAIEIARMTKILSFKQSAFNKLDKEIYEYFKKQEESKSESTQENS